MDKPIETITNGMISKGILEYVGEEKFARIYWPIILQVAHLDFLDRGIIDENTDYSSNDEEAKQKRTEEFADYIADINHWICSFLIFIESLVEEAGITGATLEKHKKGDEE